jgi:zinc finger SWIM domain-containing protein 3
MVELSEEDLLDYHEIVSKTFSGENEGHQFYNDYAEKKGFSVRKCYLERDKTTNEIRMRKFVCSRQGFREEKHMKKKATRKRKA